MMSNILKLDLQSCVGCEACANVCPRNAISMKPDERGFLCPSISDDCINCGKCVTVCQRLSSSFDMINKDGSVFYAAKNMDADERKTSKSGGVFIELAKSFIKNDGIVYGVILDSNRHVHHTRASTLEEIKHFKGSKYVQSTIGNTFQDIKKDLGGVHRFCFPEPPVNVKVCGGILNQSQ